MPRIHFVCLFGIDYDMDLLRHWAAYYKEFKFDSYRIFLHTRHDLPKESRDCFVKELKSLYGFDAFWVTGTPEFKCGSLRYQYISEYQDSLPKDDYLVVADSDEFHDMPSGYRQMILDNDVISGTFVDRWGNTLDSCRQDVSPFIQFPFQGDFHKQFNPPLLYAPICTKIMAARVSIPVNQIGSHFIEPSFSRENKQIKISGGHRVLHFTYRNSYIKRMCERPYYTLADIFRICDFFKVSESVRGRIQGDFDKRQNAMGWEGVRVQV